MTVSFVLVCILNTHSSHIKTTVCLHGQKTQYVKSRGRDEVRSFDRQVELTLSGDWQPDYRSIVIFPHFHLFNSSLFVYTRLLIVIQTRSQKKSQVIQPFVWDVCNGIDGH